MLYLRSVNRFILVSLALLDLSVSPANAVVVGDKDWLQLKSFANYSWKDFDAIFSTTSGHCDVAGCLLGGSIDLTGYVWASNAEVNSLIVSYLGHLGYLELGLNDTNSPEVKLLPIGSLDSLFNDFGPTERNSRYIYVRGWTRESAVGAGGTIISAYNVDINPGGIGGINPRPCFAPLPFFGDCDHLVLGQNPESYEGLDVGAWVYTSVNPVPAPAAIWLFGSALVGFIGLSRRRKVAIRTTSRNLYVA